ncbi:MAG: hypothetical protein LAT67_03490 [Balneolales bacterium]|nr:hypothetical protein [Balneolales bacterium]
MKSEKLLLELEQILEQLGFVVRKERGNFRGGYCLLEGDKIIMLNKNQPADYLVGQIIRFFDDYDLRSKLDDMFLKPAVRKQIVQRIKATDEIIMSKANPNSSLKKQEI